MRLVACSASGGPRFYLPRHPWGAPLTLLAVTVHAACGKSKPYEHTHTKKNRQQLSTRTLRQISTVLSRKSDILHRLDSIVIMFFVVAVIQYVSSLSLFLSPSSSSLFSARPPEDADVVLMTAMERVHVREHRSSSRGIFA